MSPESRSATSADLSGRNANPHGTSIPVATVPATVSFTGPDGVALVAGVLGVPDVLGAGVDGC
ncbi:hypothetical protein GCM10009789_29670 [Kribbella sancticallisti]|uniref:Uncharacterized protein n=1 Tax=Kribbella sancticallisti TaxID=460087 RepID=A0ABN2DBK7_9ACTN